MGRGKRRVDIKPIESKAERHTTFTKRRQGLFKKLYELSCLCDVQAAAIIFSKAGNVFGFGHPAVDDIVNRYLGDDEVNAVEERVIGIKEAEENGRPAWDEVVAELGLSEIDELEAAINKKLGKIAEIKRELVDG